MGLRFLIFGFVLVSISCSNSTSDNSTITPEEESLIHDMHNSISHEVDDIFKKKELTQERVRNVNYYTDSCNAEFKSFKTFGEVQNYFLVKHLKSRTAEISYIANAYQLPKQLFPTSLLSHEMCLASAESLSASLGKGRLPDSETIRKIERFSRINNELRKKYLEDDSYENKLKVSEHWAKFTGCLAYIESLAAADTANSDEVAKRNAPPDYVRPRGVAFYEDPNQPLVSRLNVGTYQFTPRLSGNIQACARQWNQMFPSCTVNLNASNDEAIRMVGSEMQIFNFFCGMNKLHQTFSVQVNSLNTARTHMENVVDGKLKDPQTRCVSLNFFSNFAYNHFGPLQNSTGRNLKILMNCYFK